MKVHVVLKNSARLKIGEKSPESLKRYVRRMRLRNANIDRMKRFGILTGELDDPNLVTWLERKRDVESVELDQVQEAI